jgi:acyl dehydratase
MIRVHVFYEDIELGTTVRVGSYRVDTADIVSYARRWDPLPVHIDEQAAKQTMFGGLTASGSHTLAIRTLLLHRVRFRMASLRPAAGTRCVFTSPCDPATNCGSRSRGREAAVASKPDRGVVTALMKLLNQDGDVVLSHRDVIIMRLRKGN